MKKIISLFILALMLLVSEAAFAETKINTLGTGEVQVSADTAVITLGVNARDKDVLKAQQQVNEIINAIRQAMMDQGVEETNINTQHINIYAVYDYQNGEEQLTAYNASSTLAIRVTDMESVGALIDEAFKTGANTLNGISFSASDTQEANNEALKLAVADAKEKAEILAEASGMKITGIETISETGGYSYENTVGNTYSRVMDLEESKASDTVVQAARLIVSTSVSITFIAE